MQFSRDELRVIWHAIAQFRANSEEPVTIAREENDTSPEAMKMQEEMEIAEKLEKRLDFIFGA